MSLEGYKPLDLSTLSLNPSTFQLHAPVDTSSIAKTILANTNWDLPSAQSLDSSGHPIQHAKSFVSRLMDLLSVGNYVVSDYALGAIKGHRESSTDNPIEDVLKMGANAVKGTGQGILASLKGTFGNDATANDPTGKNHIGDVILNLTPVGREALDSNSNMSIDERKSALKTAYISGLPADVMLDPLNLVGVGEVKALGRALNVGKEASEIADKIPQVDRSIELPKIANESPKLTNMELPKGAKINQLPGKIEPNNFDPETLDFAAATGGLPRPVNAYSLPEIKNPPVEEIKLPEAIGALADPRRRRNIGGIMLRDLVENRHSWETVKNKLARSFPGLDLSQTNRYLSHLANNPKAIEGLKRIPKNRINFVESIDRVLEHDFNSAGRAAAEKSKIPLNTSNAADIIDAIAKGNKTAEELARPVEGPENLAAFENATKDALGHNIFEHVIKHFKSQVETGEFPGMKNPEHYRQAISSGKSVKWSGPKQINMWQTILNRIPFAGASKYKKALSILKGVEQHFVSAGHTPYSASKASEAIPLRLSDVIEKIGPENFVKNENHATTLLRSALAGGEMSSAAKKIAEQEPELANRINQAVESSKAGGALSEADAIKQGVDAGSTEAVVANNSGESQARIAQNLNMASKTAADIAKFVGAGPGKANIASQIVKQLFEKKDPIESAISRSSLNTKTALTNGHLGGLSNVRLVTNAIQEEIDSAAPATLGHTIGPDNRAIDWLGARFNAAYRNPDMRPIYLAEAATARASVAKRAAVWNTTVKQFGRDEDIWNRAMKMAQGVYHAPVGSPEQQLSKLILQNVENLIGSSGLKAGAELEHSVAGRAQLLMDELNANLIRYGIRNQFIKGFAKNSNDVVNDYSKGIDWLHSWETWDIKDPLNFMMRLQNAVENTVREANMFNEIAARWGTPKEVVTATKEAVKKTPKKRLPKGAPKPPKIQRTNPNQPKPPTEALDHPRLKGFYFSPEHAAQIRVFMKHLEEMKKPNSKFMRQLDNVLSKWKASVTIYMPSHHVRNFIGDTYMNWLAGVNTTKPYSIALKVMRSQKGRYDSIEDIGKLTSPDAVLEAIKRASTGEQAGEKGTNIALTMRNGKQVTNDMMYTAAFQKGLLPSARVLEDLNDDSTIIQRFRPLGGRGQAFFNHASEYREHAIRLAHFADVLRKSSKNFNDAVEDAARAVRKWHPDGMDMTSFERKVMRRVFPFYSWTRKALPLMVESLVMAPGKVIAYPKVMGGISEAITGSNGTSDPFPTDQLFPQWIRDKGIGPIFGTAGNYEIVNPSNPTLDLASQFASPIKGIGGMLNPALRIPAEELTKTEVNTGAPITSQADYLTKQLPLFSTVGRVTNIGIGGPTAKFDKQGFGNAAALINLLTGLGVIKTGPYQKQAQFELRDYLRGNQ